MLDKPQPGLLRDDFVVSCPAMSDMPSWWPILINADGDAVFATMLGKTWRFEPASARGTATGAAADVAILSPMPGRIIAVDVAAGATVTKGQKLVTLEAMKMEHALTAPFCGVVVELNAEVGGQVTDGTALVRIERSES